MVKLNAHSKWNARFLLTNMCFSDNMPAASWHYKNAGIRRKTQVHDQAMFSKLRALNDDLRNLCIELLPCYIGEPHIPVVTKVTIKDDSTAAGDLDRYSQKRFTEIVLRHFPDCYVVGEEDNLSEEKLRQILAKEDQLQASIDGLDGTASAENGTNSYGAQLCLRFGRELLYAMHFRPVDMRLRGNGFIFSLRGQGAWEWCGCEKHGGMEKGKYTQIFARENDPKKPRRLLVMLEGNARKFWTTEVANVGAKLSTRPSLSSCISATTIARGEAPELRALVTKGHKFWDGWPIALLVSEARGKVTDHEGRPYSANDCGNLIAAANSADHADILKLLN